MNLRDRPHEEHDLPLGVNAMIGAMAFVIVVRLILHGTALALSFPISALKERLPNTEGPTFPRLKRLKSWFVDRTLDQLPEWAEYNGSFTILLKTDAGAERLETLVNRIPDRVISGWLQFGVATMVVFLVGWGVLLLAGLVLAAKTAWSLILASVKWALAYDWASLLEARPTPSFDPLGQLLQLVNAMPEIAYTIALLAVSLLACIVVYWVLMLFLLPGLTLHELGHYAAIRRAGGSVDSYGLFLLGPLPGGAFVEPGEDTEDLHAQHHFGIWSAGIANSLLWGTIVLSCGLVLSGEPLTALHALYAQDYAMLTTQPLSSVLLAVGIVEMSNGFLNAVPIGPVDGGGFIRTAEEEWWGFDDSAGVGERIRHVLSGSRSGDTS